VKVAQRHTGVIVGRGIVALLTLVTLGVSAQDAKTWLDRMHTAAEELSYEGQFVRVLDGATETMSIVHRYDDGVVLERISSLDGTGREIIRRGEGVECVFPEQQLVLLESPGGPWNPLSSVIPNYSEALEDSYEFINFKRGRVALRDAQIVVIKGRDDYRFGYVLWIDLQTAMPLKSQLRDEHGEVIEEILFTEFDLRDAIPDAEFAATVNSEGFRRVDSLAFRPENNAPVNWRATRLPIGFELSASRISTLAGSSEPTEHLVYSDGLATVSVFIAGAKADVDEGYSRFGSTNAYTLSLAGHKVTAMGDVPRETLQRIASSLEFARPDAQ